MSIRLSTEILGEEELHKLLAALRVQGEYSGYELYAFKKYRRPLPDRSVNCFIYNKQKGYIDIPFNLGRVYYKENTNAFLPKNQSEFEFTGVPRDYQLPLLKQGKDFLDKDECVLLHAAPAAGKTFMAIHLSFSFQYTTLVIVNRRPLLKQWKQSVEKYTTAKSWCTGEPIPTHKVQFIVTMIDGVKKLGSDFLNRIGTVILDEAHMLATPTQIPTILRCRPLKLVLCTATPDRNKQTTTILESLVGKNRVVKRYDGYLKVITYQTGLMMEEKKAKQGGIDWAAYVKAQQTNEARNRQIVEWVKLNPESKILIMTWGAEHAPSISAMIEEEGIRSDWMSKNKKKYKDGPVLVGSFGKIGVGFDPSSTEDWDEVHYDLLLLVGTTKSMTLLEQLWGRAFRSEKPHIVIFLDENKKAKGHWSDMKKLAEDYQAEIAGVTEPMKLK